MTQTITEALKQKKPGNNERVYCVTVKVMHEMRYVIAKSKGQAALEVVDVEPVTQKEINAALIDELT